MKSILLILLSFFYGCQSLYGTRNSEDIRRNRRQFNVPNAFAKFPQQNQNFPLLNFLFPFPNSQNTYTQLPPISGYIYTAPGPVPLNLPGIDVKRPNAFPFPGIHFPLPFLTLATTTSTPITIPTTIPITIPTTIPITIPTTSPKTIPTTIHTTIPATSTTVFTTIPTTVGTTIPTTVPTTIPTTVPTTIPTTVPTTIPTTVPTTIPTTVPTTIPTTVPTTIPTTIPTTDSSIITTPLPTTIETKSVPITTLSTTTSTNNPATSISQKMNLATTITQTSTTCKPKSLQPTEPPPPLPCKDKVCSSLTAFEINQQAIVINHNIQRRKIIDASNIQEMIWDKEAKNIAQMQADLCIKEKPKPIRSSKFECSFNIYITPRMVPWPVVIATWAKEKSAFTYGQKSPSAENFTQLVWADSYLLGCGFAICNEDNIYLCAYCPGGNTAGNQGEPYKKGQPCGDCACGECHDSLCLSPE